MKTHLPPKTLAKTISYILVHAPAELGLFWSPDGTMPWKELYWALQEDPSMRFFREANFRELALLGLELPASLEGSVLKLNVPSPPYPLADHVPDRLYYGCRKKHLPFVRQNGLAPAGRPFVPLASNEELALRIARRRDDDPVLIEVFAKKASMVGIAFYVAGSGLYLVSSIPVEHLLCPPPREEEAQETASKKKPGKPPSRLDSASTPGSFMVHADHLRNPLQLKDGTGKGKMRGKKEDDWKRKSRKERDKRSV